MRKPATSRPGAAPFERYAREIDGCRVALTRYGARRSGPAADAPHVVLVHGMVDSAATWQAMLAPLAPLNVWVAELPWSGAEGVRWPHVMSADRWWQTALELCPVPPSACIGHSFGALVLLDWALSCAPRHLAALVLLSPLYCAAARAPGWDELDAFARAVPQRMAEGIRARLGRAAPSDALVGALGRRLSKRCMPDAVVELMRLYLKSRYHDLSSLSCASAVIWGEHDGALVRQSVADLRDSLPPPQGIAFHALRGSAHHPMHECPQRLGSLLRRFLADGCLIADDPALLDIGAAAPAAARVAAHAQSGFAAFPSARVPCLEN